MKKIKNKDGHKERTELAGPLFYRPAELAVDEGCILSRSKQYLDVLAAGTK